jgi:hypothetical protein
MTLNVNDTLARTRRSVLLAAAGGAAAVTAVALGHPARALAADNDPLLIGADNHGDGMTALTRDTVPTTQDATFFAENTISAAVVGHATSGVGLVGRATTGAGVQGYSQTDAGVNGFGVFGVWATGENSGLFGTSTDGDGVHGETANGNGGSFQSENGNALWTSGRLHLDKVSGIATIAAGSTSKVITPGTDLSTASFVLLTPRGNLGGRDLWYTVDAAADTFRIRISKSMGAALKVGWLLID